MSTLRDLIERHYANVSTGNIEAENEIFSPDVVTVDPGAGELRGLDAFKGYEQAFHRAFPDGRLVLKSAVESGDHIVVEGSFVGTHTGPMVSPMGEIPPTNRPLDLRFSDHFEVRDGKIVAHRIYYDQMAFLGQLGLLPAPATA
jgi:ketosteroid isomerase-like protein